MFKNLNEAPIAQVQNSQVEEWKNKDLLKKCVSTREGNTPFVFYEGPPTANGKPGIHHVMARALKDSICRYKTMQGYQVNRKAGWDTHGLPVEIEVEKSLGMSGKQDIEQYGIKEFNEKCKDSVFTYTQMWKNMTERMGYLVDLDDPYITLENDYIESCWWIINEFFKKNMIYEGHKILPYCPRCGTGLASHEVAQGYKEVKNMTIVAKFRAKPASNIDGSNTFFLAWTTTPWTLAANVALTVHPDVDYIKAKVLSGDEEGNILILAKDLAGKVLADHEYEVIGTVKGTELEYIEYEQLMPFVASDKKAFFVTCNTYVTTEDGTGIVHTATAFGEDDYQTGRKYDLPVLKPVNEEGRYTETPWKGSFVVEEGLDVEIIKYLAKDGKLFAKEKVLHNYPHCWRCGTPLIYYANPSWYIEMSKLKDELVANNSKVNWYPDFIGEKRFGNWLSEVKDWAISRSRYWGTPIPIWKCECGHLECIGSIDELVGKSIEKIDNTLELHRPYVDNIHIECEKCSKTMSRIPEVMDCWFDSGAMPFAQRHYPFENKDIFDSKFFPADFICEGIDQTRGWFYSLMAISTFIKGTAPYRNVLVNDLILDKEGKKMSKSKGNTISPFDLFDEFGADATRWYLLSVSPAWSPTKFDKEGLKDVASKFFGTLRNAYNFFALYSNMDNLDITSFNFSESITGSENKGIDSSKGDKKDSAENDLLFTRIPYADRPELDRWIISKYNKLIKNVTEYMNNYDHMKTVREIMEFVSEDFSNWYIRRARRRFYGEEMNIDKQSVYATTYEVLVGVCKLAAPIAPFISDEMYVNLTGKETVHLANFPKGNIELIDEKAEERMDLVRTLVTLGRGTREKEKIKVRQPLSEVLVDGKFKSLIEDLSPLIIEELNVKRVVFDDDLEKYMNFSLRPNFKVAGKVFGSNIKNFATELDNVEALEFIKNLEKGTQEMKLNGEKFDVEKDHVEVRISTKEGLAVAMENNVFTILDTSLNPSLIDEGIAREIISKIQQMRKSKGLEMLDNISVMLSSNNDVNSALIEHKDYIMKETLALEIENIERDLVDSFGDNLELYDINGHKTYLGIQKMDS